MVLEILAKKRFSAAIFNFPDENGSRFFEPIYCTDHYFIPDKTGSRLLKIIITDAWSYCKWKYAVINLKIFLLVREILAKNRFSAAIFNFPDENGSRFFEPIYCTDHYFWTWNFAIRILNLSQLVLELLAKYGVSATILNFTVETGSRFFRTYMFY